MKILSQIKKDYLKKGAKMTAVFLLPVILIQASLVFSVQAAGPRFNIFTPYVHTQTAGHDYYLLDVKNETKNTDWNFPVSADPGDVLVFYFYYHNGVESTTALNTTMRVSLPSGQSTQHTVTAYLWADNAENATPSSPMSQSVGVNLSSSQSLDYVAGSAKWYPDRADWRYDPSTPFPSGQSEQQLFGSGINVGSIIGCWEYSGAIVFKAKVGNLQPPSTYDLSISKTVRNITAGQSSYSESVNAVNNDRLSFQIQIQNTGNAVLNNVIVRDALPSYISYLSGTTKVDGVFAQDGIASSGINIGSINTSMAKIVTFEASVNTSGLSSSQTLTNYGYGRADQVAEKSDTATVYVSQQQAGNLNIVKYVRNLTTNQASLVSSTNANAGDRVLFSIQISNYGSGQVNNVRVWDTLPSGLTYVSGSVQVDNVYSSDSLFSSGINLGTLVANQSKTINFEATVNSGISNQTLINYAYVVGDGVGQLSAYAQVVVGQVIVTPSGLVKKVANVTLPNGTETDNQASVGDVLNYTISYTNTSGPALYNVQIFDVLPSYTSFQSVENSGVYDSTKNQITWNIGTMSAGASVSVSYRVKVLTVPVSGTIITNTALFKAQAISDIISNETRTTVLLPGVKGVVTVVTGSSSLVQNLAYSLLISILFVAAVYLVLKHADYLRWLKLKLMILKIKIKES